MKVIRASLFNKKTKNMKKIRVYNIIRISIAILILFFILSIVLSITGKIKIPWIVSAINVFTMLIGLGSLTGIISKYDFYKRFDGEIIDEYEVVTWSNITKNRWIVFFVVQLTFIFLNHLLIEYLALPFVEGWSLGKEHTVPLSFKLILTLSPLIIFVFGSFIWRINKSESDLIKLRRRDRIRTSDINELKFKVDLEEWFLNDPYLQQDKELFRRLIIKDSDIIGLASDKLKKDKEFILELLPMNYVVGNNFFMDDLKINENDLNDELIVNIADQVLNLQDIFDTHFMVQNSSFAITFTKRIIDINQHKTKISDNSKIPESVVDWYLLLSVSLKKNRKLPVLESFRWCDNHNHIISIEESNCPYC
jgi:hypothetical protein